jgi:hypothetical protein
MLDHGTEPHGRVVYNKFHAHQTEVIDSEGTGGIPKDDELCELAKDWEYRRRQIRKTRGYWYFAIS